MRDRLIELIQASVDGCAHHWAKVIADHLLANGVIVPPCKIGDTVFVIPTPENGRNEIEEMKCLGFEISAPCPVVNLFDWKNKLYQPSFERFGVSVFLTVEEAQREKEKHQGCPK